MNKNNSAFGILWDMDGVLVDTGELHYQVWASIMAEMAVPFNRDIFRPTFGMNNATVLATWLGRPLHPELTAQIADRKEAIFRETAHGHMTPLPGVTDCLQRFQSLGCRQAVASSAPPENVEGLIQELGLRPYFAALVSSLGRPGKPEPDVFLEAARQLDLPPERCLVIEDALVGIEAAHRAGMRCLAVATTYPLEALQSADLAVERLDTLPADAFPSLLSKFIISP